MPSRGGRVRRAVVVVVALAVAHCCAGSVAGATGDGSVGADPASASSTPASALQGRTVALLSNRGDCALTAENTVACWGSNQLGELGDGSSVVSSPVPVAVRIAGTPLAGKSIVQLAAGFSHTCALTADSTIACWGDGSSGQMGNGARTRSPVPVAVTIAGTPLAGKTITAIASGMDHTCALAADSTLACWGANSGGQLGLPGSTASQATPVAVSTAGTALAGESIAQIALGQFHSCALSTDGDVVCWGFNGNGQVGDGSASSVNLPPVLVKRVGTALAGKTITQLAAGRYFTCALATDSTIACWGANAVGQTGSGTRSDWSLPVAVATGPTPSDLSLGRTPPLHTKVITQIRAGFTHACALTADSVMACWGSNALGALGNGSTATQLRPVAVTRVGTPLEGQTIRQITVSTYTSCAVTTLRVTSCWGYNRFGYLGNGLTTDSWVPSLVLGTGLTPDPPFASWSAFVTRQHLDLTGANPGPSELSSWSSALTAGSKTTGDLIEALRRGTDNSINVDPTARLYRAFLSRAPDAAGLEFWVERRRTGGWTLRRMADFFANSAEFKARYGTLTNRQFVTRIYTDVLGRTADTAGVDFWTAELDSGRRTRGTVMIGFSESLEYKRKQAENTDVAVAHIFLLGRAPTLAETTAWVTRQKAGTAHAVLATELLSSAEYATHAAG